MANAIDQLAALMARHDGFPPQSKATLRRLMSPAIARADAEFDALCERISQRRDWLDKHRSDDPPHPKYAQRLAHFREVDGKAHAEAGELLDRAYRLLTVADKAA